MPFTAKAWANDPTHTSPISAAALIDMETRLSGYAEALALPVIPFKRFSNLSFDGVTDVAPAINAALVSIYEAGAGGGLLGLPSSGDPGMLGQPVVPQNTTGLVGGGHWATWLRLANGVNSDAIQPHVSDDDVEPNAEFVILRDFMIDGNKANQSQGACIFVTTSPQFTAATTDYAFDPNLRMDNVRMINGNEGGFSGGGRSEAKLTNCVAADCGGYGFLPSFDTTLVNCSAGNSGLAGFYIPAPSVRLIGCKSFYSGQDTNAPGFEITSAAYGVTLNGCESQDNTAQGYLVSGALNVLNGCLADSNSTAGSGSYAAADLFAATDCRVDVRCYERRADGANSYQTHALKISGGSLRNDVAISHAAVPGSGAAVSDAIDSGSTDIVGNGIAINNEGGTNPNTTFAASYTPEPYDGSDVFIVLTGDMTVVNPPAGTCHAGSVLRFFFQQDGTGGWDVTLPGEFNNDWTPDTTAGVTNVIQFQLQDDGQWYQTGAAVVGI